MSELSDAENADLLPRADGLARQMFLTVQHAAGGPACVALVRQAALVRAVARRLAWYGIPTTVCTTRQPEMLCLTIHGSA
ncbi:MAG: hypothetical protein JHC88_15950 [Niveispirillum sp.]|nr:hypothetical protein [Niveispirillum sp.]